MNKLKEVAEKYIGQTEISGNKGFNDKKFEKKLKEVGWGVEVDSVGRNYTVKVDSNAIKGLDLGSDTVK